MVNRIRSHMVSSSFITRRLWDGVARVKGIPGGYGPIARSYG